MYYMYSVHVGRIIGGGGGPRIIWPIRNQWDVPIPIPYAILILHEGIHCVCSLGM